MAGVYDYWELALHSEREAFQESHQVCSSVLAIAEITHKEVRLIALLPIKYTHSAQSNGRSHAKQSAWNDEITHRVLQHIFRPLLRTERNSPSSGFHCLCADG